VLKESPQTNIYLAMLPPELVRLNDELSKVSVLLDNEDFLAPFVTRFKRQADRSGANLPQNHVPEAPASARLRNFGRTDQGLHHVADLLPHSLR